MASEAHRRYFCPHESQDLGAHQPSNHKTVDHSQCSESFYTWSGLRCWPTLCMRWLLEYLIGAVLSVSASILDGCDGEVARLKLMESDFGCWLETVCDYL